MDLRLLEYFVAVAELEHVGQAAQRLHISQSPLSRQIRQLEAELQLELFVRERQRIRLTESGRWLLSQAQALLGHSRRIREEARSRAAGSSGTLAITFTSAAMWNGVLPKLLRKFQAEFPDAHIALRGMRSAEQVETIQSGRADIGFVSQVRADPTLDVTCVWEEPVALVVPGGHVLARRRQIRPCDLTGASWVLLTETEPAQQRFLAACASAGFEPRIAQRVTEPGTLLALVESGFGLGLMRSSARQYAPGSLVFRKLPWLAFRPRTYMIRPAQNRQPLAERFAARVPRLEEGQALR